MKAHKARSWNSLNLIWFWFSASQNAPDLEMGGPPLGFAKSSNAANDGTITLPEASSTTPLIIQEVLASGVCRHWKSHLSLQFLADTTNSSPYY